jgi:hydrogenase small subunit
MAAYSAAVTGAMQFDLFKLKKALADNGKPNVIWFEGLGDSGCVVSLANYFDGSAGIEGVLLNHIEMKFNSVLMGASGQMAVNAAQAAYDDYATTPYVLVLSGAISNLDGYAIIGQDDLHGNGTMQLVDSFSKWEERAAAVLFVGSCACYGGVNSIGGGNIGPGYDPHNDARAIVPNHNPGPPTYSDGRNLNYNYSKSLFLPGCPAHPDWIVLSIVDFLTNGMPSRDAYGRPLSLLGTPVYANTVHSQCPRKADHDTGNFADTVGDPQRCLVKVGCRGKDTFADCPTRGWNSVGTYCNKPGINGLCIGCTQPLFPDVPFNREIGNIT